MGKVTDPDETAAARADTVDASAALPASSVAPERARVAAPGASMGRFKITSTLGEGGMGVVLLAVDPLLGRRVAIKVLNRGSGERGDDAGRRLLREAQSIAQISHENVIAVHEVGTHDEQVYVAMEYVPGGTLGHWQAGRGWRDVLSMYLRAGQGLVAAHDAGLVHRDFKPDNVLVGDDGRVRVTDFGLVAATGTTVELSRTDADIRRELELELDRPLTRTGAVMGTPRYMAPEQHLGEAVDARSDQFAFCVALYAALYHHQPFAGTTYAALAAHVMAGEVEPVPADSPVRAAVRDAILRGLARQPGDRHPSMRELLAALELALAPTPAPVSAAMTPDRSRPRTRTWLAVGAVVVVAALVTLYFTRGPHPRRDGIDDLAATLADPRAGDDARTAAALALTRSTDPRALSALATALVDDHDSGRRLIAARALAEFAGKVTGAGPPATAGARAGTAAPAGAGERPWATGVSSEEQQAALSAFNRANLDLRDGRFAEAIAAYRDALTHWRHPAISYNLALALLSVEESGEAFSHLEAALAFGPAPLDEDKFERGTKLRAALARVVVRIEYTVGDATLVLDGKDVLIGPGTYRAHVRAGEHTIAARVRGTLSEPRTLTLAAGETSTLTVP
jgi:tetratricopeptide (TPR) repeat protein